LRVLELTLLVLGCNSTWLWLFVQAWGRRRGGCSWIRTWATPVFIAPIYGSGGATSAIPTCRQRRKQKKTRKKSTNKVRKRK
jgi:hypothetical protein